MNSQAFRTEDFLDSQEAIAAYLDAALEDGDERVLLLAPRNVASKFKSMSQVATEAELSRETLYRTFSEKGNLRLDTLAAVLKTIGLRLSVTPLEDR